MVDNPIDWLQNRVNRASEAATEWFKQKSGLRDVMPKNPSNPGRGDIQSAVDAGKQINKNKNPYGR